MWATKGNSFLLYVRRKGNTCQRCHFSRGRILDTLDRSQRESWSRTKEKTVIFPGKDILYGRSFFICHLRLSSEPLAVGAYLPPWLSFFFFTNFIRSFLWVMTSETGKGRRGWSGRRDDLDMQSIYPPDCVFFMRGSVQQRREKYKWIFQLVLIAFSLCSSFCIWLLLSWVSVCCKICHSIHL